MAHLTPVPNQQTEDDAPESAEAIEPAEVAEATQGKGRPRTSHPLPSDRIAYQKQLEILRAFAVAAADNGGSASNENVGKLVKMSHTTVALSTPFFVDSGFLTRADRGRFRPSEAVVEYSRAYQWTPDRAGHHLANVVSRSWFGQVIMPRVSVSARDHDEILAAISAAADATTEHRQQLVTVIEFAVLSGIVERQGSKFRAGRVEGVALPDQRASDVAAITPQEEVGTSAPGIKTGFVKDPTEGYVEFHVDVKVRTAEFATWRPERISAFFGGIAQVLAAKGRMEEDAGSSG
jgi:hypothetical protein